MIPRYEDMLETVYRTVLRPGDVALDIGAHTGRHALPIARAVGSAGRVHAFEPIPEIFDILTHRVEATAGPDMAPIRCHNLALGTEDGTATFNYYPDFPEYSGFEERIVPVGEMREVTLTVPVRQLDGMAPGLGPVRYVKVDAEGAELMILRGAQGILGRDRPVVTFEMGDNSLVNYPYGSGDFFDFFHGFGYRISSIFGLDLERAAFVAAASRQFFWDYIAYHPEGGWRPDHSALEHLVGQFQHLSGA